MPDANAPTSPVTVYPDAIARERIKALALRLTEAITAQERANGIALSAAEKAVLKAETAMEKRFDGVNEFRQTLSDQAATFVTRKEVEALLTGVNSDLKRLDNVRSASGGREALSTPLIVGLAIGALTLIGVLTGHVH